jgi:histone-lysine N-methyltransferase SETMAR
MVLLVRSGNETPKHVMKNISITEAKKGTYVTSTSKDNAHLFFDHKGIVHFEFLEQGRTVNQHCYLEILARLREAVRRRRPELWPDAWILHHDNTPAHNALDVREFLAKKSIMKLDHPPYSPDLAPCDFLLFPKLKTALKGHRFSDIADIQGHATTIPKSIPEEEFRKCFEQWKHRLTKCIGVQGDYFEGDSNH